MGRHFGEHRWFFGRKPWAVEVRGVEAETELLSLPDGLDFLFRPVAAGWIKYESLVDGTLSLEDLADLNQALDVFHENEQRQQKQE